MSIAIYSHKGRKMIKANRWSHGSAFGVISLALVLLSGRAVADDPSTSSRQKWEYAELRQFAKAVLLCLPGSELETETLYELCNKLRAKKKENTALAVLNALGDDGWELVAQSSGPGKRQVWTFKRYKEEPALSKKQ
jgi:hypothetical protein